MQQRALTPQPANGSRQPAQQQRRVFLGRSAARSSNRRLSLHHPSPRYIITSPSNSAAHCSSKYRCGHQYGKSTLSTVSSASAPLKLHPLSLGWSLAGGKTSSCSKSQRLKVIPKSSQDMMPIGKRVWGNYMCDIYLQGTQSRP